MSGLEANERCPVSRRALARVADAMIMAAFQSVTWIVCGFALALIARPEFDDLGAFVFAWMGLMMPASVPAVCYEVVPTARRGQTYGKRCMEIRVVPWNGGGDSFGSRPHLPGTACMVRWAIPHGAGLLAAVVAGVASFRGHTTGESLGISAGAGLAAWLLVYASSLWDTNGRGWHDKAAGTVVVSGSAAELATDSQRA